MNRYLKDSINTTDMCWKALKAQLECNVPNKNEVAKLSNAMIMFVKNLSILQEIPSD